MSKLSLLILSGILSFKSTAYADVKGNGGDYCTQMLIRAEKSILWSVDREKDRYSRFFNVEVFKWHVERTNVVLVPKTVIDGQETDAANYPACKFIEVSRSRWCALHEKAQEVILFH